MARGLATRGRFAVPYLVLGAAVGLAVGGAIGLAQREGPQPGPPWSSWEPTSGSTSSREVEIAQHVPSRYKLPTGVQLVTVKLGGSNNAQTFGDVAIVKP